VFEPWDEVTDGPDPLLDAPVATWQPRIVPSPPPQRSRLVVGILVGLLCGLVVFGLVGYLVGARTGGGRPTARPTASAVPTASPTLPPYEQSLLALNAPKVSGDLAAFAQPWLPRVSSCTRDGEKGGPGLSEGEATRVLCGYGSNSVYLTQYTSIAARDKARTRILAQNIDARELTAGARDFAELVTPSGRTKGAYLEYAYKVTSGDNAGRIVVGVWWDDKDKPVAGYLLAFWAEGLGGSWEPLRDIWQRTA
jgi:hypothetical protein